MAMGTRKQRQRQEEHWYRRDLAEAPGHPFYRRLREVPHFHSGICRASHVERILHRGQRVRWKTGRNRGF